MFSAAHGTVQHRHLASACRLLLVTPAVRGIGCALGGASTGRRRDERETAADCEPGDAAGASRWPADGGRRPAAGGRRTADGGQHPYRGPSLGAIGLIYTVIVVSIVLSVKVYQRATAGIAGPSVRQRQFEGVGILISFFGSPVIQGALKHYHASNALVYGVIPAAGPLIIVGTTVVGIAASRRDWPQFIAALAAVTGGFVAAFVGPSAAWLAAGIGLFVAVVGYAAASRPRLRALTGPPVA